MAKMIHLPNSTDIAEIRRVFELVQRDLPKEATTTNTKTSKQAGVSIAAPAATTSSSGGSSIAIPGPAGPAGADGSSNLMIGAMLVPEILLDANGDVLTDPSGYALIGVKVESVVLTGIGDTIQAMGV